MAVVRSADISTTLSHRFSTGSYEVPAGSELPVAKNKFPFSSTPGPAPDIHIDDRKKVFGALAWRSSNLLAASGVSVLAFHPSSQPREEDAEKSQKLENPA